MAEALSVSEITGMIKQTVEKNFGSVNVLGEISNFKAHYSGHWYFTLKDSDAQINCAMWRSYNSTVFFTPQDGMKIYVSGRISVYPPRGTYQIDVRSMRPAGEGELQAAFEKLKKKLAGEGLFDDQFKKTLPAFPSKIGIVTASDGAAFRDMISVAGRRYPLVELVIIPTKVQGDGAAEEIAANIRRFNSIEGFDLLIIGRGGGSLEDLWAFNEEIVARAVFESQTPIISGVGHEIDYTISDFVADLRAPTPSAAMELATPSAEELVSILENSVYEFSGIIEQRITDLKSELKNAVRSYGFRSLENRLFNKSQELDSLFYMIDKNTQRIISNKKNTISLQQSAIGGHDHSKILRKGFTIIKQNGKFAQRAEKFDSKTPFSIKFFDKEVEVGNDRDQ